jgi:methylenetetrahydrofolate dehydrogenase (NADP+) / methenyltetrahydrofolate cyclohydrolase
LSTLLDGRAVAAKIRAETAEEAAAYTARTGRAPGLAAVVVGEDPASLVYLRRIASSCAAVGIDFRRIDLAAEIEATELRACLSRLNDDPRVSGVIVQMPLPKHLAADLVGETLSPEKDVDGVCPANAGRLLLGLPSLVPSTPLGGLVLLERYGIPLKGAEAVVVGRSPIVGKPMASLLLNAHATVTICHSRTRDLATVTRRADVLVAAIGKARMITADMVKPGAAVIDFGINPTERGIVGDVDPGVGEVAGYLTPVPGGTGPMTNAMLMRNTLAAARRQAGEESRGGRDL